MINKDFALENAKEKNFFSSLPEYKKLYNKIVVKVAMDIFNQRKQLKMNQKQFSKYMGVSQSMISKWESGNYNFTIENISKIYSKLNIEFSFNIRKKLKINVYDFVKRDNRWKTNNEIIEPKINGSKKVGLGA